MKSYNALEDIIVFGSALREKSSPKDIDIALLLNQKNNSQTQKAQEDIYKTLPELKIDITIIGIKDLYHPLWISIIKEGFSISKNKFFRDIYGVKASKLYKYSIKKLTPVQKVQFDRGLTTVLKSLDGIRLARTIVIISLDKSEQFEEFLKTWGIEFETQIFSILSDHIKNQKVISDIV